MLKKVFWVSLGFFLLTLIFLGVYQFAFRHNPTDPVADPLKRAQVLAEEAKELDVPAKSLAFEAFLNEPLLFPGTMDSLLYYYSPRDQAIKRVSYDGKSPEVIMRTLPGTIKRLVWSPAAIGTLALVEASNTLRWYTFDFRNGNQIPLKGEMSRLAWNSLGDSIIYQFTETSGSRSLNIANMDGSNWKKLADLGTTDVFVAAIPQSSRVSFWNRPTGLEESTLESISITGEGRTTLLKGKYGGDYLWSPDGMLVLVGSSESRGGNTPLVGVMQSDGSNFRDLRIPTLINKIVWSRDNQTLYYTQPGVFPPGTILPNDYFGKPILTKDTFWKMNIKTGKRERLVPLEEMNQAFDATDLFLAPDETSLFFINRSDSKLYRISL